MDRHAPLRSRNVTDRRSAPWMSSEIKALKSKKRRAERRFRKSKLKEDKLYFKFLQYLLNDTIISAKKLFYESKIAVSSSNKVFLI